VDAGAGVAVDAGAGVRAAAGLRTGLSGIMIGIR
jgi:hypothetical protein